MKKEYLSPEFETKWIFSLKDVLADSRGENTGSGGSGSGGEFDPPVDPELDF